MCGIAGWELADRDPDRVAHVLLDRLAHRGPDGGDWASHGPWGLAQTRLAIIDLSDRVRYPMANESGDLLLLFNGEIYDHDRLRRELQARGHVFATKCDAEVVVHGYEEWGSGIFARLNGMWALALADRRSGDLVLARDARGIKPLVRTTRGPFAFGSDAMALVAAGLTSGAIDRAAIAAFAAFHYVPEPMTGLEGLEQVAPGSFVRRGRDGRVHVERWAAEVFTGPAPRHEIATEEADMVLREAVRRQLRADVEVGVFLSGGLDSALILSYAAELGAQPTALTLGFRGFGDYDESAAAAAMARRFHVRHEVERLDVDFPEAIRELARAYDSPFADPSAIATLRLARLARRHVTVALSGTGGDDLFAGYYRHRAHALAAWVRRLPDPVLRQLERVDPGRGVERTSALMLARSYAGRLAATSRTRGADGYLGLVGTSTSPAGLAALREPADVGAVATAVARAHGLDGESVDLDVLQRFELRTYLPGDLLVKEDRATMAHSVEGRVPLLDDEVVSLAARTPPGQRASWRGGKRLLREVARTRLPERRGSTRKRGFAVPLRALFDGPWRADAVDWIGSRDSTLVDSRAARALVGRPGVPALDVWALCALCAWEDRLRHARVGAERGAEPPAGALI